MTEDKLSIFQQLVARIMEREGFDGNHHTANKQASQENKAWAEHEMTKPIPE